MRSKYDSSWGAVWNMACNWGSSFVCKIGECSKRISKAIARGDCGPEEQVWISARVGRDAMIQQILAGQMDGFEFPCELSLTMRLVVLINAQETWKHVILLALLL
jgi:hypothetical protein